MKEKELKVLKTAMTGKFSLSEVFEKANAGGYDARAINYLHEQDLIDIIEPTEGTSKFVVITEKGKKFVKEKVEASRIEMAYRRELAIEIINKGKDADKLTPVEKLEKSISLLADQELFGAILNQRKIIEEAELGLERIIKEAVGKEW